MKLFLDDSRPAPAGWLRVYTPKEAIDLLKTGKVTHLSLDHDLGDDAGTGTGYDVLTWLEEEVFHGRIQPPGQMYVHSDNASARQKMKQAISSILRMKRQTSPCAGAAPRTLRKVLRKAFSMFGISTRSIFQKSTKWLRRRSGKYQLRWDKAKAEFARKRS